jgi:hypothetical protein
MQLVVLEGKAELEGTQNAKEIVLLVLMICSQAKRAF